MQQLYIDLQYLPSVAYFAALYQADEILIEGQGRFEKRSFNNRCQILTANKVLDLSVPVHGANRRLPFQEVTIDYHEKWVNQHWRAIQSAYGKSPFFDFYADGFKEILYSNIGKLFDLNFQLLTICLAYLKIDTPVKQTESLAKEPKEGLVDLRGLIHPRKSISEFFWFTPKSYYQIFGKNFVPNLSILDLLFCTGPEAIEILNQSSALKKNN